MVQIEFNFRPWENTLLVSSFPAANYEVRAAGKRSLQCPRHSGLYPYQGKVRSTGKGVTLYTLHIQYIDTLTFTPALKLAKVPLSPTNAHICSHICCICHGSCATGYISHSPSWSQLGAHSLLIFHAPLAGRTRVKHEWLTRACSCGCRLDKLKRTQALGTSFRSGSNTDVHFVIFHISSLL